VSLWDRIKRATVGPAGGDDPLAQLDVAIHDLESAQDEVLAALESADARDRELLEDGLRQLVAKLREARAKRKTLVAARGSLDRAKAIAAELRRLDAERGALSEAELAGERGRRIRARVAELRGELAAMRESSR
jgi:hypothetical protein